MSTHDLGYELHDYITELTRTHEIEAEYDTYIRGTRITQKHRTKNAPLLTQLAYGDTTSTAVEGDSVKAFGSKPVARIDALDALAHIDLAIHRWLTDLGTDEHRIHLDTTKALQLLGSLAPATDKTTRRELTKDVHSWWIQARIITGWDSPAWHPDNTCPNCTERGTLRIRLVDEIATCIHCRAHWDKATIGVLAEHIRSEGDTIRTHSLDVDCYCPLPLPYPINDFTWTCRACGSPRCRHAITARNLANTETNPDPDPGDIARPETRETAQPSNRASDAAETLEVLHRVRDRHRQPRRAVR